MTLTKIELKDFFSSPKVQILDILIVNSCQILNRYFLCYLIYFNHEKIWKTSQFIL